MKAYKKQVTKYYKYTTSPNVNIIGSLVAEGADIKSFSSSKYAIIPVDFSPTNRPWEFVISFSVTGSSSTNQTIVNVTIPERTNASFNISVASSKFKLTLRTLQGSTVVDIINGVLGTHQIALNTVYYVKVAFTGSQYTLDYSTDNGNTYTRDMTVDSTLTICKSTMFTLGQNIHYSAPLTMGTIGLKGSYLEYDGERVWAGTLAEETTSSSYDFSKLEDIYYMYKKDNKHFSIGG